MDPELPQYARSSTRPRDPRPSVGSSSSGSRRNSASRAPSEHSYHLTDSKGRQWLSLKVISNAPSSGYLPAFYEGDAIGGSVSLHREKEDSIKSISVQVLCTVSLACSCCCVPGQGRGSRSAVRCSVPLKFSREEKWRTLTRFDRSLDR